MRYVVRVYSSIQRSSTKEAGTDAIRVLRKRGIVFNPLKIYVQPKSGTQQGQWMCADCGDVFANNLQMWGHPKKHRIGWWTGTHMEEP